jgi:hypothetical protein
VRRTMRIAVLLASVTALLAAPTSASAAEVPAASTFTHSQNMHPMGFSARANTTQPFTANSDLAFRDGLAFQGNYDGFRIIDIHEPDNPVQLLDYRECAGNQGDVIVWGNILVRSWNSPAPAGATCDGEPVLPGVFPGGWEGLHVFDISNLADPDLVASVETECGSHTATAVPDPANNRLLVYNTPSSGACPGIDIVQIPVDHPEQASYLRFEPGGRPCHDTGVILGSAMLAACAGGDGFTVWSMSPADGGSLEDPVQLYSKAVPGVTIGHSAGFTWHNYNVVPTDKRYVLVSAAYQAGIQVVDFTDPANAKEVGFADPAPLSETQLILGGDWSDYWYDGRIYESDITRGMLVWNLSDSATAGARKLGHLNPQTQEFTIP